MKDMYAEVTNRIIAALEQGTPPWICPWQDHSAMPSNLATAKPYRGINVLMLHMEAMAQGFADSRWLTLKQANDVGGRIRKGEHGTPIVFFKWKEVGEQPDTTAPDEDNRRVIPMLRSYTVFNASQLEILPERFELRTTPAWQPISEAEQLLQQTGAVIRHGGNHAFYSPSEDFIQLPPPSWFPNPDDYYAIALHELTHWTGNPQRLNRVLRGRKDIDAYAMEELIAEMGAAFLCAHCQLPARLEHATYIEHWLQALKNDKRLIFVAAGAAQKAADFVLGIEHLAPSPSLEALAA